MKWDQWLRRWWQRLGVWPSTAEWMRRGQNIERKRWAEFLRDERGGEG